MLRIVENLVNFCAIELRRNSSIAGIVVVVVVVEPLAAAVMEIFGA